MNSEFTSNFLTSLWNFTVASGNAVMIKYEKIVCFNDKEVNPNKSNTFHYFVCVPLNAAEMLIKFILISSIFIESFYYSS